MYVLGKRFFNQKVNLFDLNYFLKADLEHLRAVKVERHLKFAKEKEMANFNVSAKTGESVSS